MEDHTKKSETNVNVNVIPLDAAATEVAKKTIEGIGVVLGNLFKPVTAELGNWMTDGFRTWRLNNISNTLDKYQGKFTFDGEKLQLAVNPRILHEVIEGSSKCDDENLQEMWAGILGASTSEEKPSDENLIYTNALKLLSTTQAKIVKYICTNCSVVEHPNKLLSARDLTISLEHMYTITGSNDMTRIDSELDGLSASSLTNGGFTLSELPIVAEFAPNAFLLNLYARCQGHKGNIIDFYSAQLVEYTQDDRPTTNITGYI
jgi:hypothetical protein